jgi:hypothetical protein
MARAVPKGNRASNVTPSYILKRACIEPISFNVVVKARAGVIIREFYGVETEPGLGFEDIVNAIVIAHSA